MEIIPVKESQEIKKLAQEGKDFFLLFYKEGADHSRCAMENMREGGQDSKVTLLTVDVSKINHIHAEFGVTSAPTLLEFKDGRIKNLYKGCHQDTYYKSIFDGGKFAVSATAAGKKQKRVVVYTTPTCTWCNTLKTYFRENNITYSEVDVASNPSKAEEMVRKSGQQGVPQTDIEGQMIIGFDKKRINDLLEIR